MNTFNVVKKDGRMYYVADITDDHIATYFWMLLNMSEAHVNIHGSDNALLHEVVELDSTQSMSMWEPLNEHLIERGLKT